MNLHSTVLHLVYMRTYYFDGFCLLAQPPFSPFTTDKTFIWAVVDDVDIGRLNDTCDCIWRSFGIVGHRSPGTSAAY